jgi:hypothetical protein
MDMSKRICTGAIILFAAAPFVATVSAERKDLHGFARDNSTLANTYQWTASQAGAGLGSYLASTTREIIGHAAVVGGATKILTIGGAAKIVSMRPGPPASNPPDQGVGHEVGSRPPSPVTRTR